MLRVSLLAVAVVVVASSTDVGSDDTHLLALGRNFGAELSGGTLSTAASPIEEEVAGLLGARLPARTLELLDAHEPFTEEQPGATATRDERTVVPVAATGAVAPLTDAGFDDTHLLALVRNFAREPSGEASSAASAAAAGELEPAAEAEAEAAADAEDDDADDDADKGDDEAPLNDPLYRLAPEPDYSLNEFDRRAAQELAQPPAREMLQMALQKSVPPPSEYLSHSPIPGGR